MSAGSGLKGSFSMEMRYSPAKHRWCGAGRHASTFLTVLEITNKQNMYTTEQPHHLLNSSYFVGDHIERTTHCTNLRLAPSAPASVA